MIRANTYFYIPISVHENRMIIYWVTSFQTVLNGKYTKNNARKVVKFEMTDIVECDQLCKGSFLMDFIWNNLQYIVHIEGIPFELDPHAWICCINLVAWNNWRKLWIDIVSSIFILTTHIFKRVCLSQGFFLLFWFQWQQILNYWSYTS